MTTVLNRPVSRETVMQIRDRSKRRSLIITLLLGDVIEFRPKGTRQRYVLGIDAAFHLAMKQEAARQKAERAAKRKAKK